MDGYFWFIAGLLIGAGLGAWEAVRQCSMAVLLGKRQWWIRALYRSQQRQEYVEFSRGLDAKMNASSTESLQGLYATKD